MFRSSFFSLAFRHCVFPKLRPLSSSTAGRILPADSPICWHASQPVKLHISPETAPDSYPPIMVHNLFQETVNRYSGHEALVAHRNGNDWKLRWNYGRYYQEVKNAAKGFIALGLNPGHSVGIMANNSPAWFVSSLAAISAGGLSCGIHLTNATPAVTYIVEHAPTDILVLEDAKLLRALLGSKTIDEVFPRVEKIVLSEGNPEASWGNRVLTWSDLIQVGQAQTDVQLDQRHSDLAINKACMLIYTSGTTGPPKGALLSHDNVTWSSRVSMEHYDWKEGCERVLSYLPMSHAAAHLIDCYMIMLRAGTVYIADKNALKGTLVDNLRASRPTKFYSVPRVWEKMHEKMAEAGRHSGPLRRALVGWAKSAALEHYRKVRSGVIKPDQPSLKLSLARKLIFSRVHDALGLDQTKLSPVSTSSTAAPLSKATYEFFESLDIEIAELYGCTESSGPISTNLNGIRNRPGTVGQKYFGVHAKILDPDDSGCGEIATRARNTFMGYHRDEKATKASFTSDFWFRTGDLGRYDDDGFLTVTGRLKEILVTSGGKKVAPVPIEDRIKATKLNNIISNVVVIGDQRKFLSCLLTLKVTVDPASLLPTAELTPEAIDWCTSVVPESQGKVKTIQDFREGPFAFDLHKAIEKELQEANKQALSSVEVVRKFLVLPREFTITGGELTPSLKLMRYAVAKMYHEDIEKLYQ